MASSGSSSTSSGPVATGSRRRRLVLRLSQKDALQALFQRNPYPGIATRERLARELGIAESRVQVWFQNQRRRRSKQSRSPPSEYVHQEGEAGPTSTPTPPTRPPRPQSSSPGNLASVLPKASPPGGVPNPPPCQRILSAGMVSKPKSSAPPAEPERARRRSSHDSSCSRGPKGPTRCPEHLSSPSPLPATGEHATLGGGGRSCSVRGPRLLGARDCLWGSPSLQDALLAAPGIPGSPGPFPGSSPVVAGAHPAFPGSPSLLEEILAATATRDTPWSPPGPLRGTRGL
ncbi:hypothetical protein CapIbe_024022, partial [Capra ibex]